jgi:hypothetical protein
MPWPWQGAQEDGYRLFLNIMFIKLSKAWLKVVVETIAGYGKIFCKFFMTVQEHFTAY